jgi:N-acetylneuraminic acid mutarotase
VNLKWKSGPDAPFQATRFDGALVDKKVYFLGFRAGDDSTDGSVWYYDTKSKDYVDTGTDMPVPLSNYTVAVLQDKTGTGLYTFGGRDSAGQILTTVQVYYPDTNTAKEIKGDPWPGTTPSDCVSLPATGVAVVDNTAYVVGGASFSTSVPPCTDDNSAQVWSFNPKADKGKKWKAQPDLKVPRGYIATAVVGGKTIYAIGGDVNDAGTLLPQATVEAWKVGSKKWNDTNYADLPEGCDESQAFAFDSGPLGGTITLAGCGQWPNALPDVLQYDVAGDSWSNVGALKEARRNQAGANIGSDKSPKLMVLGGYSADGATVLATSEIGTPASFFGGTIRGTHAQRPSTAAGRVSAL